MKKNLKAGKRPRRIGASARSVQYTVRNIPSSADRVLRRKAREERKSLNEVLRQAILKEAGGEASEVHEDLLELAGTWIEDPDFDAAIAAQDRVDESMWK